MTMQPDDEVRTSHGPAAHLPDTGLLLQHSLAGVYLVHDGRFTYPHPRMADIVG